MKTVNLAQGFNNWNAQFQNREDAAIPAKTGNDGKQERKQLIQLQKVALITKDYRKSEEDWFLALKRKDQDVEAYKDKCMRLRRELDYQLRLLEQLNTNPH